MTYQAASDRYNDMVYKRCGNSGLLLPFVSLGLWHNFGDIAPFDVAKDMIFRAFDLGITHFDLANNYGPPPGTAESNFGKILHQHMAQYRDEMVISSKAGYLMWDGPYGEWGSRKYLISSLDQSLKRMQLDYVDIFYSHRPDPHTPLEETMGALDSIVRSGKALYVGISNYNAAQTRRALEILDDLGTPCLIHQPRYNMFDRWTEQDGLHDVLEDKGVGCIPFSPLAQGLLTNKYLSGIPADSRAADKNNQFLSENDVSAENIKKVQRLNQIAEARGQTMAQLAICWLHRKPSVASVIIGASKVSQIEDIVAAQSNLSLTEDEIKEIDAILD
ncbi:aldo/keto reductase [Neptunicella marina]|uniref:Aldo/keto reductase n=1 Tax=Neptunicella marina TaxID=2125989 RepID=A0A8J6ITT5_9ALTE|nr:aldo/keto reductase [Neptunicella marina]MBC3766199.1 aldo/keto reductase [Neptunicella marina]